MVYGLVILFIQNKLKKKVFIKNLQNSKEKYSKVCFLYINETKQRFFKFY